jgi:hypothetical protein
MAFTASAKRAQKILCQDTNFTSGIEGEEIAAALVRKSLVVGLGYCG